MGPKSSNRRADLRNVDRASMQQDTRRNRRLMSGGKLKCRVTGQFLPGEPSPFADDDTDLNKWRVTLIPEDAHGASFGSVLQNKSFPISCDPDVIMQTYGSHGLLDKTVLLEFTPANLRSSGEVNLDSASNFGLKNKIDASDVAVARANDLGSALLFSLS